MKDSFEGMGTVNCFMNMIWTDGVLPYFISERRLTSSNHEDIARSLHLPGSRCYPVTRGKTELKMFNHEILGE